MTPVERTWTVLNGGIPDRVPVDLHNFMMTATASGMSFPDFFQDGEAMAEAQIAAWREFGHDVLLVENGTAALAEACGCAVEYMSDTAPVAHGPAIESLDDIDKLEIPDPYKAHPLKENLKATKIIADEIGDEAFIIGRADQGPFSLASMLLGMDVFLLELGRSQAKARRGRRRGKGDPEVLKKKLHRLLEFSLEATRRYARAQMEMGAHMTSIGESLSGPDVCSRAAYLEFEWGYAKRLTADLAQSDVRLAYHICGDATNIVGDMVETGAAVLELDYKIDMPKVKDLVRGHTTVLGPIDPSNVLARGTPDLVTEKVKEAINVLGADGGLILGPGCALPPNTPADNVHAMIDAAHKYGRYKH
jgi:uroporphyrinogen decarboxylase